MARGVGGVLGGVTRSAAVKTAGERFGGAFNLCVRTTTPGAYRMAKTVATIKGHS